MIENKSKMFELLLELHESMRNLQRTYKVAVSFEGFYFASLKVLFNQYILFRIVGDNKCAYISCKQGTIPSGARPGRSSFSPDQ